MSRQDRIAQLMALLNDAESSGDDDKIIEIKSDIFKEFGIEKNMGGMMNMDEIIRPLGYAAGGPIPREEPIIKPKEKPIDFDALMAEFDKPENKAGPGAPTGIEKIIADQFTIDPRFTMKQKIKKMLGIGGDQGSGILDDSARFKNTTYEI